MGVWWCAGWIAVGGGVMALNDSCGTGAAIAGVEGVGGEQGHVSGARKIAECGGSHIPQVAIHFP